jgi:hypothetical protein
MGSVGLGAVCWHISGMVGHAIFHFGDCALELLHSLLWGRPQETDSNEFAQYLQDKGKEWRALQTTGIKVRYGPHR